MFKINDEDLLNDYILTDLTVSPPEAFTMYVEVPGRSGTLDLSESLYGLTYKNRAIKAMFVSKTFNLFTYHLLLKKYQGKVIKLFLESDYYFSGRLSFSNFQRFGNSGRFDINIHTDPYRYKINKTTVELTSTVTEKNVMLPNEHMPTNVKLTTSSEILIKHGTNSYSFSAGTHILPFELIEGINNIKVKGNAILKFEYQEGVF